MESLHSVVQIILYVVMALTVLAAVGVVLLSNIFYAALALVAVLIGTAGIYLALHADFIALVQILLYVGAVMTLLIFGIMLTQRFGEKSVVQRNQLTGPALLGGVIFFGVLVQRLLKTPWPIKPEAATLVTDTRALGDAFLGQYVFPFEVISVILIVAMIGAIIIAKKDPAS